MDKRLIIPKPQIVRVDPAIEKPEVGPRKKPRKAVYEPSGTPMRCQFWNHRELMGVAAVTFDDMGHPQDVSWNPKQVSRVTRVAFIYGGRTYAHPLPEPVIVRPGNPLYLALRHLKLLDKFGKAVLKAGS
jgi:hypothetical protein